MRETVVGNKDNKSKVLNSPEAFVSRQNCDEINNPKTEQLKKRYQLVKLSATQTPNKSKITKEVFK